MHTDMHASADVCVCVCVSYICALCVVNMFGMRSRKILLLTDRIKWNLDGCKDTCSQICYLHKQ